MNLWLRWWYSTLATQRNTTQYYTAMQSYVNFKWCSFDIIIFSFSYFFKASSLVFNKSTEFTHECTIICNYMVVYLLHTANQFYFNIVKHFKQKLNESFAMNMIRYTIYNVIKLHGCWTSKRTHIISHQHRSGVLRCEILVCQCLCQCTCYVAVLCECGVSCVCVCAYLLKL